MSDEFKKAVELANKAFDVGSSVAATSQGLIDLKGNFQSHKEDIYKKIDALTAKFESLPDRNEMAVIFAREGEKLAGGILKQVDKVDARVNDAFDKVGKAHDKADEAHDRLNAVKNQGYGFAACVTIITTFLGYLGFK